MEEKEEEKNWGKDEKCKWNTVWCVKGRRQRRIFLVRIWNLHETKIFEGKESINKKKRNERHIQVLFLLSGSPFFLLLSPNRQVSHMLLLAGGREFSSESEKSGDKVKVLSKKSQNWSSSLSFFPPFLCVFEVFSPINVSQCHSLLGNNVSGSRERKKGLDQE